MTHAIAQDDHDIRLDRWFKRHYPGLPHSMLEKYLRKGLVRLDGKKVKASERLVAGSVLSCPDMETEEPEAPPPPKREVTPQDEAMLRGLLLYQDDHILVINKPHGLAVQGGTNIGRNLDDLLGGLAMGRGRPKLVHRLDRDTSGVLVLARNAGMAAKLAKGFAGKAIEKTYWALVHKVPDEWEGVIDLPLAKSAQGEYSQERVAVDDEDGKSAKTEYRVIESLARKFSLMELKPLTGRTHQLRVHMEAIGCPIVGDSKYGGRITGGESSGIVNALHLHARRIVIPASIAGKNIDVQAPLPKHMARSFDLLGLHLPK